MYTLSVTTSAGNISVWSSQSDGKPVLFLHGNSACKEAFSKQFHTNLSGQYKFYAIDLPGHGESAHAKEPEKTYNIPGYADVALEVITHLNLVNPVLVGWSLGGHIALSMVEKGLKVAGLLLTGTPPIPITQTGFQQGFRLQPKILNLFAKETFTKEEAETFMEGGGFKKEDRIIISAAQKTDGMARVHLAASFQKEIGGDQKAIVENNETPLCMVQGTEDSGINNDYIQSLSYKNLFNKQVYLIPKSGHAVFWEKPDEFNEILSLFLSIAL